MISSVSVNQNNGARSAPGQESNNRRFKKPSAIPPVAAPEWTTKLKYLISANQLNIAELDVAGSPLAPGERVRIRALREIGSARLLDGLTGEVVGPHPVARDWYKIHLDPNSITPHSDWSAPGDRLVRIDEMDYATRVPERLPQQHFP